MASIIIIQTLIILKNLLVYRADFLMYKKHSDILLEIVFSGDRGIVSIRHSFCGVMMFYATKTLLLT